MKEKTKKQSECDITAPKSVTDLQEEESLNTTGQQQNEIGIEEHEHELSSLDLTLYPYQE